MASPDFDPFAVLGVPLHATPDEIRSAYRQLAAVCHPDIQPPDKKAWASEQMIRLNAARDLLLDPRWRAQYHPPPASRPRPEVEKNRWREQAAQAAYASARRHQTAAPARASGRRLVYTLVILGLLGLGLYSLPALMDFFQDPVAALQALANAGRQFQITLINVGHSLVAAGEVVLVAGGLAFIAARWLRRRKP